MTKPTVPAYASTPANYGARRGTVPAEAFRGALVVAVRPDSPAYDAGIEPGMYISHVNDQSLTDMIVWLWEADEDEVELTVFDPSDDTSTPCVLERFSGEDWGLTFNDAIFDEMRTCVNACVFCFMRMLPKESRDTLTIRDDDYRLSFLQGNFVTLTNMSDGDVEEVIDKFLSPMNVSIHAVSPDVRRSLIGRNAGRGIEVLERLMDAGIEIHAQIVLCPGLNDGD
uniref:PDZ domain-containing protein n=1 Tax=Collinsella sp. D33t1_170424_A12 TaxID=2787135 RepID=UPI00351C9014